ncbi:chemotaxis protein MotB [Chitinivorax tropicus]|uniref:Chemotaxis protein MotB n=1 Tax=Chitinivorax tropicus TaxID=714531 RepID=A0A840MS02_9PROT|nr:flagellar motor protein MotB [Chitinivorax tropicus]MBB5019552.1 chemotaxis protein MotB [Chitinivorax tropicus]
MSDDSQRPIIVKKIKKGGGGHHGGAWKIAYADFVTAMMAFFLLMWLLGSTAKGDLKGIADYFKNPLKVALSGGSGSGDATSLVPGGGEDLSRTSGQVKRGDLPRQRAMNVNTDRAKREAQMLQDLKQRVEKLVEKKDSLKQFKNQLLIDMTAEGLRIQIVDEKNRPMFDSGSADMKSYAAEIIHEIAALLNEVPNRISLSGHTDATPFSGGDRGYSNWELSADRANASRRELIAGGIKDDKIIRVVGLAAATPFDTADIYNPINRRISITVLNAETEQNIVRESGKVMEAKAFVDANKPGAEGETPAAKFANEPADKQPPGH